MNSLLSVPVASNAAMTTTSRTLPPRWISTIRIPGGIRGPYTFCVGLSVYVCVSVGLSVYVCVSVGLSVYFVCLSACLYTFVCLSACL